MQISQDDPNDGYLKPQQAMVKNDFDNVYHLLLQECLLRGADSGNRTGTDTRSLFVRHNVFDLRGEHFPLITTKKVNWTAIAGELLGFLRGYTNVKQFKALGCNVWDENANADYWTKNPNCKGDGDLGRIYGAQWRDWHCPTRSQTEEQFGKTGDGELRFVAYGMDNANSFVPQPVDQFRNLIDNIQNKPDDRRLIVTAWNPGELDQMALPPCHMFYQTRVRHGKKLDMMVYIRSNDLFLGAPFNIASYALLTHIICGLTWTDPGILNYIVGDYHIYHNHLDQVKEQLSRIPFMPPKLKIHWPSGNKQERWEWIMKEALPQDFEIIDYEHHPALKAKMAV